MTQKRDKTLSVIKETGQEGLPAVLPVTFPKWEPPYICKAGGGDTYASLLSQKVTHFLCHHLLLAPTIPPVSSPSPLVPGLAVATSAGFLVLPKAPGRYPCSFARNGRQWMSFLPTVYVYRIKLALSCVLQRSFTKNIRKALCGGLATSILRIMSVLNRMIKANASFQSWWPHLWLHSYMRKYKSILLMWKFENYFIY